MEVQKGSKLRGWVDYSGQCCGFVEKLPRNLTPWPNIPEIMTLMSAEVWGRQLATHSDESFWEYLVEGQDRLQS